MRILRGSIWGSKVTVFMVLPLLVASVMTMSSPRPASAEGPLLGTVRCLLGTLLAGQCRPVAPTSPTPPASPAQPTAPAPSTGSGSAAPQAPATQPSNESKKRQVQPIQAEPMPMPEEIPAPVLPVEPTGEEASAGVAMSNADHLAFFNKYSKYAVAGAQQEAAAATPVERSDEGWRIFGVAWYWWGIGAIVPVGLGVLTYRKFLRKYSVL